MPSEWTGHSRHDPGYADWLETVSRLCRFNFGASFEELDPELLSAHEFYERQVTPDEYIHYVRWYLEVDDLCVRFLSGCHLWAFEPSLYSAEEYFDEGWTPEGFFTDVLVPALRDEYENLDALIADAAIWGSRRGAVRSALERGEKCEW